MTGRVRNGIAMFVLWTGALLAAAAGHAAVAAIALSLVFLGLAAQVFANQTTEPADMKPEKRLFAFSILYLFGLFGALVVDHWMAI